ncbi:MAG: hypothetical protein UMU76_06840 [Prosthecochloris sp.]|nr:hypothetical protein [Prosthecochloris sp.]
MIDDLISRVEQAVDAAERWPDTGWPVRFGQRMEEVANLEAAEQLPRTAVYREEALNYWRQARLLGQDTAAAGRRALQALREGRLHDAANALYLCQYLEQPLSAQAGTWVPVYKEFRQFCSSSNN